MHGLLPYLSSKLSYSVIVVGITRTYKKCKPKHSESSKMERIARQGNILWNGERPIMLGKLSLGSLFGQRHVTTSSRTGN
jgi:hypothetical protein